MTVERLYTVYQEDDFIAEEGLKSDRMFFPSAGRIVDLLGGTTKFAHGFPHFWLQLHIKLVARSVSELFMHCSWAESLLLPGQVERFWIRRLSMFPGYRL